MTRITPEEIQDICEKELPWVVELGMTVETLEEGVCTVRLPYRDVHLRPGGTISGPAMMTVADFAMYGAVLSAIGRVELAVTINLNINFLRRPKPGDILAEARLLKLGKRLAVGDVLIHSEGEESGEPVAHATSTYSIPPR